MTKAPYEVGDRIDQNALTGTDKLTTRDVRVRANDNSQVAA
jgi:hypothetical protein